MKFNLHGIFTAWVKRDNFRHFLFTFLEVYLRMLSIATCFCLSYTLLSHKHTFEKTLRTGFFLLMKEGMFLNWIKDILIYKIQNRPNSISHTLVLHLIPDPYHWYCFLQTQKWSIFLMLSILGHNKCSDRSIEVKLAAL